MSTSIDMELKQIKTRLIARREELNDLVSVSEESRDPVELDQTRVGRLSRMDALQNQAMSLETGRRRQAELERIEATLKRIDKGDFGYCLNCGEDIAPKRLQLDPTLPMCIDCASYAS